jgi:hypothetical protein
VVAGKLEALSEAAGPYAQGVGDVDVPAARGAVSYGGSGRDMQYPSVVTQGCGCSRHGRQARQSERHGANYYSTRAHD